MMKLSAIALLSAVLIGCGGGTTVEPTLTQGQELLDLKSAYDQGIITEKEYNKTKEQILKR